MNEKGFNIYASNEQMRAVSMFLLLAKKYAKYTAKIEPEYTDEEFNAFKDRVRGDLIGEILTQHIGVEGVDFNQ